MKAIVIIFALLCAACVIGAIAAAWADMDETEDEDDENDGQGR